MRNNLKRITIVPTCLRRLAFFMLLSISFCSIQTIWATPIQQQGTNEHKSSWIQEINKQKNQLNKELNKQQKEYQKALKKLDSKKEKPNSRSYKKAVQKAKEYESKIESISIKIQCLNIMLDSLEMQSDSSNNEQPSICTAPAVLSTSFESSDIHDLENSSQEYDYEYKCDSEDQDLIKGDEYLDSKEETSIDTRPDTKRSDSADKSKKKSKVEQEREPSIFESIIGTLIILALLAFFVISSFRCPNCGKWFTMKFISGSRTWDKYQTRVFKKTYQCSECGYRKVKFEQIKK